METNKNKKEKFPVIIIIIGLLFVGAFLGAMGVFSYFHNLYEGVSSAGYAQCRIDFPNDPGNCNFQVTQEWNASISKLSNYSHIVFLAIFVIAILVLIVLTFVRKDNRRAAVLISAYFGHLYLAFVIADVGFMYTIGKYVGFGRSYMLEYLAYFADSIILVDWLLLLVDAIAATFAKKSFLFAHLRKTFIIFEWVSVGLLTIVGVPLILTLLPSEPFAFALAQLFVIPFAVIYEFALLMFKIISRRPTSIEAE